MHSTILWQTRPCPVSGPQLLSLAAGLLLLLLLLRPYRGVCQWLLALGLVAQSDQELPGCASQRPPVWQPECESMPGCRLNPGDLILHSAGAGPDGGTCSCMWFNCWRVQALHNSTPKVNLCWRQA